MDPTILAELKMRLLLANETALGTDAGANLWLVAQNAVQLGADGCLESSGANLTDRCAVTANATDEEDFNTFYFYQVTSYLLRCYAITLRTVSDALLGKAIYSCYRFRRSRVCERPLSITRDFCFRRGARGFGRGSGNCEPDLKRDSQRSSDKTGVLSTEKSTFTLTDGAPSSGLFRR